MATPTSIELFLADGTPGGLIAAEISGWTGKIIAAPRKSLGALLAREEAQSNGVYILLGEDAESINNTWCYIGRSENFAERLRNHQANKPKWQRAIIILSLHHSFNEGHWGYMEAKLLQEARKAGRCSLDENKNNPRSRKLSESQEASVNEFIRKVKLILPMLGVNILRSAAGEEGAAPSAQRGVKDESPVFSLVHPSRGVDARMRPVDGELFVLEGSRLIKQWDTSGAGSEHTLPQYESLAQRHRKLIADGSLRVEDDACVATRDIVFNSPSTAAAICLGHSSNGRKAWQTRDGMTYAQWEAAAQ
ncbi:GIY-YIG nuclease family protein [Pseudoglutamicibacter cumminsii]|uniref:GIY-YIG nuclease family protein n=1 Tax=Pseudoglutamicibacter cumminsii TaxID=156979 RepID=UPI0025560AEB|nr:GIY-YIG nuclease family protein [Pseudoglutamicibacter cumminsii]MDZ3744576.1 GIY-YIG nuclease family protein [Pseudoglutamicibacter cumminsii]